MDLINLRIKYKQDTGDQNTPISNEPFDSSDYIEWLEYKLISLYEGPVIRLGDLSDQQLFGDTQSV